MRVSPYFATKHVRVELSSTVTGTTRSHDNLDQIVATVGDARVRGGLHYRTTMTKTAKEFPSIARQVAKHFRAHGGDEDERRKRPAVGPHLHL